MSMKKIRWTQWSPTGMVRCGEKELIELMKDLRELGLDAARCLKTQEKPHAVYGRKMYENGKLKEIRLYCDTYVTDEELEKVDRKIAPDILYVAHKI